MNPLLLLTHGWIYKIISSATTNQRQYEVIVGNFPTCICVNFVIMLLGLLGRQRKWNGCHVNTSITCYNILSCGKFEIFIHFPTRGYDEVHHLLFHAIASKEIKGTSKLIVPKNVKYITYDETFCFSLRVKIGNHINDLTW